MANKKITDLTAIASGLASGDLVPLVDVSDTTDAASGTTKKMTWLNYLKEIFGSKYAADAGASDTYAATLTPAPAAYVTGEHYRFKANTANTGACTINFNGLGAKAIKKAAGGITTDLADNDIRAGQWVDLVYDGSNMQMQSLLGNAPAGGTGGFGDVVGPSSATDNALARFDSTTGKLIQDSTVTLDDTGAITVPEMAAPSTPAASKVSVYAKADGLMYSKDDAGTETLMSSGGSVTTEQIQDIVGAMIVGGTDIDATYDDGAGTVTIDNTGGGGGAGAVGADYEQYKVLGFNALPASTNFQAIGANATAGGGASAASADDADGVFIRRTTAATTNSDAGVDWTNFRIDWLPQMTYKMKTYTSVSVCRIFVGMFSGTPLASADPAVHGLGFRFDTSAGDTNWQAYSNDNSGGGTITNSGVSVTTDTLYNFKIVVESTSSVKFYISTNNGVTYSLVATHTTNLPGSGGVMTGSFWIRTLENVAKSLLHSWAYVRMR